LLFLYPPPFTLAFTATPSPPTHTHFTVSTQPAWIYSPENYNWRANPDAPDNYCRGSAATCNNTLLGDYYERLYGYFLNGFMTDEAGILHNRPGGPLNITTLEIFNEVDYEHGYTVEQYTQSFDAVVLGVRRAEAASSARPPTAAIKFVGMNLPNIDDGSKVASWAAYFLNASNHSPEVQGTALDYIGYHAYPTNGPYKRDDPNSFSLLFEYVDSYIEGHVLALDGVIATLSPNTRTVLDETGADMDGVLGEGPPPDNNPRYWVAAASYWAYMYMRSANDSSTVVQCGSSQLMDAPGQEPSVTLLDWSSGNGTARFWVVRLFVETFDVGATLRHATVTTSTGGDGIGTSAVYAMGVSKLKGSGGWGLLLINKRNAWVTVSLACNSGGGNTTTTTPLCNCASMRVIDEFNRLLPAREEACESQESVVLAPYATAVVTLTLNKL